MMQLICALVALSVKSAVQAATIDELQAREPEVVIGYVTEYVPYPVVEYVEVPAAEAPQAVECGCCGANVTNWWTIRNDADTAWVDVCELCYLRIAADDYYWPEPVETIIEGIEERE